MYDNKGWFHGLGSRTTFDQAVHDAQEKAAAEKKKTDSAEAKKVLEENAEIVADKKIQAEQDAVIEAASIKSDPGTGLNQAKPAADEAGEEAFAQRSVQKDIGSFFAQDSNRISVDGQSFELDEPQVTSEAEMLNE